MARAETESAIEKEVMGLGEGSVCVSVKGRGWGRGGGEGGRWGGERLRS